MNANDTREEMACIIFRILYAANESREGGPHGLDYQIADELIKYGHSKRGD